MLLLIHRNQPPGTCAGEKIAECSPRMQLVRYTDLGPISVPLV